MHELGTRAYTANQETRNPTTDVKNVKIFHKRTAISDKTIENYYRSITLLKCGIRISHYHFKISSFPVECRMTLRYSGFEYFKSDAKFKFCPSYKRSTVSVYLNFIQITVYFLRWPFAKNKKYVTPVTLLNGSLYRFTCYAETVPNAKGLYRAWLNSSLCCKWKLNALINICYFPAGRSV